MEHRKIIHIDMDAFYASVEQRDFPEYRGKAIAVGGSPTGRGVVATCSYEARKFGVHSAMPSARAIRLCPHLIFVKARFDVYREVSHQIREIFFEYTDLVEPLSLDEAYLDVTKNHKQMPSATLIAKEIKEEIKRRTDLTASAGISNTKFLAKIASDLDKPDGITLIPPEKARAFIEELPIGEFYGIGKATEEKMKRLGIYNGADLKSWSEIDLVKKFGKSGRYYYNIARGVDRRRVKPNRIRKSIGKERTFSNDVDDMKWIANFLQELAEKIAASMEKLNAAGKTITLKARYADFETVTRSTSFAHYISDAETIGQTAIELLDATSVGDRKVRLLGITLSNLNIDKEREARQLEIPFERG